MGSFIGRVKELDILRDLKNKNSASLVCLLGRRRIGKSTLIQQFAKDFKNFTEIQGLEPSKLATLENQLAHFASELSNIFNIKKPFFTDWDDAFHELARLTKKDKQLILLDEISWMANGDPLFSAKLKSAWDTRLSKNSKLILVTCGSISTWIEKQILKNPAFEGRIALEMNLQELNMNEIDLFWKTQNFHMGAFEKMILLSVTGGVPKYIEEILKNKTASENIARLCFQPNGFLYNEYDKIFKQIFQRRAGTLDRIIRACLDKKLTPSELANKLRTEQNSDFSEQLHILEMSGFLSRDYFFKPDTGKPSSSSHLRVKDNYLRFYLKMIEPSKIKIEKGGVQIKSLTDLKGYESLMGFQFENLILRNKEVIHERLGLTYNQIVSSAPYSQKKSTRTKGSCQIDLLIHTNLDVFFICEMKCQKVIDTDIIKKMKQKMKVLNLPRRSALKPVLICLGEISPNNISEFNDFFFKIIRLEDIWH